MMKFQLILQFDASAIQDFDKLVELESNLESALGDKHVVDGHDFGSNEMNIFIHTDDPDIALSKAKVALTSLPFQNYVAAHREFGSETYTVIHPETYEVSFSVV